MAKVGYVNYEDNLKVSAMPHSNTQRHEILTGANMLVKNMNMMGLSPKIVENHDDQEARRGRNIDLNELKSLLD